MKLATIFLFALMILTIIPNKHIETEPLIESNVRIMVKGEGVKSEFFVVHKDSQIKDILSLMSLNEKADIDVLDVNQVVYEDMVIQIPLKKQRNCISLNYASLEELMTLSGVGVATGDKIIEFREKRPFILLEDLMLVPGIGIKKYEKIKDEICL